MNIFKGIFFILVLVIISGCNFSDKNVKKKYENNKLVFGSIHEPVTLNPLQCIDAHSLTVIKLIYNGLLRYKKDWKLEPDLCEDYKYDPLKKEIVFKLKNNIRFSNGKRLTPDDVVSTYKRVINGNYPFSSDYSIIKSVEGISLLKVKFVLKREYAPLLHLFTLKILPQDILEGKDGDLILANNPVGTGPYKFIKWESGEMIYLKENPYFFGSKPNIKEFVYQVIPDTSILFFELLRGKIHIANLRSDQFFMNLAEDKKKVNIVKYSFIKNMFSFLAFNLKNNFLKHRYIREAIAYAINKKDIIKDILFNTAVECHSPFSPTNFYYNHNVKKYNYSIDNAKDILEIHGYKLKDGYYVKDGKRISLKFILPRGNHQRELVALSIKKNLKDIGIYTEIIYYNWHDLIKNIIPKKKFDILLIAIEMGPDPDGIYSIFHSNEIDRGFNMFNYKNEEVDELLERGRFELNTEKRKKIYYRVQQILSEDIPLVFLYHPMDLYGVNEGIKDLKPISPNFFYKIEDWKIY